MENSQISVEYTGHDGGCCYRTYFGFHTLGKPLNYRLRSTWLSGARRTRDAIFPILTQWARLLWAILQVILALVTMSVIAAAYSTREKNEVYHMVQLVMLVITAFVAIMETLAVLGSLVLKSTLYGLLKYSDPMFNIAFELLLYPAVICSLMDTIQNETYEFSSSNERLSFVAAILTGVLFIFSAYCIRLILGWLTINHTLEVITTARCFGRCFLLGLFLNLVAQIAVQICLFILIGIRFRAETDDSETDDLSPFLWTMIVLGEVIPLAGIFAYFITTYKCIEDVPLTVVEYEPQLDESARHGTLCDVSCLHPCVSPIQIMLCIIFACLVIGFFLCFSLQVENARVSDALGDKDFYDDSGLAMFLVGLGIIYLANCFPITTCMVCSFTPFVAVGYGCYKICHGCYKVRKECEESIGSCIGCVFCFLSCLK